LLQLASLDSAIGRPEQSGIANFILTRVDVFQINFIGCIPTLQVIIGMITYGMALFQYFPKERIVLDKVIANTKKSSLCLMCFKLLQHKVCGTRYGPIIKSQKDFILSCRYAPDQTGI